MTSYSSVIRNRGGHFTGIKRPWQSCKIPVRRLAGDAVKSLKPVYYPLTSLNSDKDYMAVYSLELVITVGIATLIIGAIVGAIIAQRTGASQRTQREMEAQLTELQQQAQTYQKEVSEHFSETADLLNQLTTSYRDVHNHLAKGAQALAVDGRASQRLKSLPSEESDSEETESAQPLTPPLDYAVHTDSGDNEAENTAPAAEKRS